VAAGAVHVYIFLRHYRHDAIRQARLLKAPHFLPQVPIKYFANIQTVAAVLVLQSVADFLPLSFYIDETMSTLITQASENADDYGAMKTIVYKACLNCRLQLVVSAVIIASATLLVNKAHAQYLKERSEFLEGGKEDISEEDQVDRLLPFWSAFCLSYCPRSAHFENKVLRRRIACFLLPMLIKVGVKVVMIFAILLFLEDREGYFDEKTVRKLTWIKNALGRLEDSGFIAPLVGTCFEALSFVLVSWIFLRHQLKRPYISPRLSAYHGDPINNAEIMTTRVLCWGAVLLCLQTVVSDMTEGGGGTWIVAVLCALMIVGLTASQPNRAGRGH